MELFLFETGDKIGALSSISILDTDRSGETVIFSLPARTIVGDCLTASFMTPNGFLRKFGEVLASGVCLFSSSKASRKLKFKDGVVTSFA